MLKLFNFIFSVLLLISCSKDAPNFKSEIRVGEDFLKQKIACKKVNLYKNALEHSNTLEVFKCFNWEQKYPTLFNAIREFSVEDWNYLVMPLNKTFFSNEKSRLDFMHKISELKEDGGFENLDKFVKVFIKNKDFFDFINRISDQSNKSSETFEVLMTNLSLNQEDILRGLNIYYELLSSLKKDKGQLRKLAKFLDLLPGESDLKVKAIDLFVDFVLGRDFYKSKDVLSRLVINSNGPWLYKLANSKFSVKEYERIIYFEKNEYPELMSDVRVLRKSLKNSFTCPETSTTFDINAEIENELLNLSIGNQDEFVKNTIDARIKLEAFSEVCPSQKVFLYGVNRIHSKIENLLQEDWSFYVISNFHKIANGDNKLENREGFFDYIESDFYDTLRAYSELFYNDSWINQTIWTSVGKLSLKFHTELDKLLETLIEDKNIETLKSLAKLWRSLPKEDKLIILSLADYSWDPNFKMDEIIFYYKSFFEGKNNLLKNHKEILFYDSYSTKRTFNILNKFLSNYENDRFIEEFSQFLSKDSLIRLFQLFSEGIHFSTKVELGENLNDIGDPLIFRESPMLKCMTETSEFFKKNDYYSYLLNMPASCNQSGNSMIVTASWLLYGEEQKFQKKYGRTITGPLSIISRDMMRSYVALIVSLQESFIRRGLIHKSMSELINDFNERLLGKDGTQFFDSLMELTNEIIKDRDFSSGILIELTEKIKKEHIIPVLNALNSYKMNNKRFKKFYTSCSEEIKGDINADKCPTKERLKGYVSEIIDILSEKNDSDDTAIQLIVDTFYPGVGMVLPTHRKPKKQRRVNLTLRGTVESFYDLGGPSTTDKVTIYKEKNTSSVQALDALSKIEMTVKDISFLENFYGAYFMNTVASAKNFYKKVKALKRNVNLMNGAEGLFRTLNQFPEETDWKMKNIKNTYDGLIQAGENYGDRNHSDMFQTVLAIVSASSPKKGQKYNPWRLPKPSLAKGHKGKILTILSKMRGFSHLAAFSNKTINNNLLNIDHRISIIDKNLLNRFSHKKLVNALEKLLEEKSGEIKILTNKLIDYLYNVDSEKRWILAGLIWESMYTTSVSFNKGELDIILSDLNKIIDFLLRYVNESKLTKEEVNKVILFFNYLFDSYNNDKNSNEAINVMFKILTKKFNNSNILDKLNSIEIAEIDKIILSLINIVEESDKDQFRSVTLSLRDFLTSKNTDLSKVAAWIKLKATTDMDYLIKLVDYLNSPADEMPNKKFIGVFKQLFINNKSSIEEFLDTFSETAYFCDASIQNCPQ